MTFAIFLFVSAPEIIRVGGWCYVVAAMMRLMPDVPDFFTPEERGEGGL